MFLREKKLQGPLHGPTGLYSSWWTFENLVRWPKVAQEASLTSAMKLSLLFDRTRCRMSGCDYLITES